MNARNRTRTASGLRITLIDDRGGVFSSEGVLLYTASLPWGNPKTAILLEIVPVSVLIDWACVVAKAARLASNVSDNTSQRFEQRWT